MNSEDLMEKLKQVYKDEEMILEQIKKLKIDYEQLQLDKEMLKNSIVYMTAKGR